MPHTPPSWLLRSFSPVLLFVLITALCLTPAVASMFYSSSERESSSTEPARTTTIPAITSFDVLQVALYVTGLTTLSSDQLSSADVSGNCLVNSFDDALIARWVLGTPGGYGLTGQPGSSAPCGAFIGIIGDVSGTAPIITAGVGSTSVSLPSIDATPGTVTIPVTVGNTAGLGIVSYDFQVTYDPNYLTPASPAIDTTGTLSSPFAVVGAGYNSNNSGQLIVSYGSAAEMNVSGSAVLINLKFNVSGLAPSQSTALSFQDYLDPLTGAIHPAFLFNEGTPSLTTVTNGSVRRPLEYTISGNVQADGANLPGATVSLTGSHGGFTTTDANGNYSFTAYEDGDYTVTVSKAGYTFDPASKSVFDLGMNETRDFQNGVRPCATRLLGLAGWWRAEGDASDSSGNNINGTAQGSSQTFPAGRVGTAFDLDGTTQYISAPNHSAIDTPDVTVDAWVRSNAAPTTTAIVLSKHNGTDTGWYLGVGTDLKPVFSLSDPIGGTTTLVASTAIPVNSFVHLAASFDSTTTTARIYINGVQDASGTATFSSSTTAFAIGRANWAASNFFDGLIDEVQIFDLALASGEIQTIYQAGNGGMCQASQNTPQGFGLTVETNGVSLYFEEVTQAGQTVAYPLGPGQYPTLPNQFALNGTVYEVHTTAVYAGEIDITFMVPSTQFDCEGPPPMVSLHYDSGTMTWTSDTNFPAATWYAGICTVNQIVFSLSPFATGSFLDKPTATNTLTATNTATATATSTPAAIVSGTVTYGNPVTGTNPRGVPGVLISAAGLPPLSDTTTASGTYSLTGFGSGSYTITPSKSGGQNGAVLGYDAALIASYLTGNTSFTPAQQTVADPSGVGGISSYDAALIARYAAALGAPTGSSGSWIFSPTSNIHSNITSNITDDYSALLMGDVSGNWGDPSPFRMAVGPERSAAVSAPHSVVIPGSELTIPITVQRAADKGIISYDFDLRYDPTVIQPVADVALLKGTVSRGLSVVVNAQQPGLLRVVVYGSMPIASNGVLLNLRFIAIGQVGSISRLTWERMVFNEGDPMTTSLDGQIELSYVVADSQ